MKGQRVKLTEIKVGARFRRWGASAFLGACVRLTENEYCEEDGLRAALEALDLFPICPGEEQYDLEALVKLALEDSRRFQALSTWNGFYRFHEEDFARSDKRDFYLYPESTP